MRHRNRPNNSRALQIARMEINAAIAQISRRRCRAQANISPGKRKWTLSRRDRRSRTHPTTILPDPPAEHTCSALPFGTEYKKSTAVLPRIQLLQRLNAGDDWLRRLVSMNMCCVRASRDSLTLEKLHVLKQL